jgi:DNA-binding SARP family transcriptional activator
LGSIETPFTFGKQEVRLLAYLHISLFGTFQVTVRGRHAVPIESDKAQALLAYLALEGGQPHRRDSLAALFWPEANGQKARQSLRQSLYTLRRSFNSSMSPSPEAANSSLFETSRQHIRFSANGQHWLDVTAFTVLLDQCQNAQRICIGATCWPA